MKNKKYTDNNTKKLCFKSLQAIVLFCGLGINNTMLYDQMAKAKAKQQVALEVCISLHKFGFNKPILIIGVRA